MVPSVCIVNVARLSLVNNLPPVEWLNVTRVRHGITPLKFRKLVCGKQEHRHQYIKGDVLRAGRSRERYVIAPVACIIITCGQQPLWAELDALIASRRRKVAKENI